MGIVTNNYDFRCGVFSGVTSIPLDDVATWCLFEGGLYSRNSWTL